MSDQEMEVVDDDDESENETMEEGNKPQPPDVYLPNKPLEEGEELICDQAAYVMLHQAQTGAPCLSFDIIKDNLGANRETYPLTAYIVTGTQAPQTHVNNVIVLKLSNLYKTNKDDDDDDEEDSDDEVSKKPKMAGALIKHQGCVNRIRVSTLVYIIFST